MNTTMGKTIIGSLTPVESKYEWKIPNYRSYADYRCGKCLHSSYFCTYHNQNNLESVVKLQWQLQIYPNGKNSACGENFIAVFLINCNEFVVTAKHSVTIVASEVSDNESRISEAWLFNPTGKRGSSWGWINILENESVLAEDSMFLVDETLTIHCSISEIKVSSDDIESPKNSHVEALNSFENLLESGKFGDVTFNIGEKKIHLHKAFLTSASTVFQTMFDHDMQEQKDGVVNIVDMDFDVMKEMFRFIYARKVNDIDKIARDLLVAADKYCVTGLKELCEKTLCENLNVGNALQYLELAVEYNATKLKSKTLEFASKKLKNIVKTEEFKSMSSECKSELLLYMACNQ